MDSFDLTEPSSADARKSKSVRIVFAVLAIAFTLMAASFVALASGPGGLRDVLQLTVFIVVESCLVPVVGLLAFGVWKLAPGAIRVMVDAKGVHFVWRSGRADVLVWKELTRGFALLDYSGHPFLPRYTPYLWEARRWQRPATRLTREAFEGILKAAREQGLEAKSSSHPGAYLGWAQCVVYTFSTASTSRTA
jgi:hypothetical protein